MTATDLRADWSEKVFQSHVIARATELGWMVQHSRGVPIQRKDGTFRHATPISGHEGYPDVTLVKEGHVAFLELKSEKGQASDVQLSWLAELSSGRPNKDLWRSREDTPDGAALHRLGGWADLRHAGDWIRLVALIRPRHYDWIVDQLAARRTVV